MSYRNPADNIYPIGALVYAKNFPLVGLEIRSYNKRIYYCAVIGDNSLHHKAYYEREIKMSEPPKSGDLWN